MYMDLTDMISGGTEEQKAFGQRSGCRVPEAPDAELLRG